jgi:hypothetical protein
LVPGAIHRDRQTALGGEPDRGLHIRIARDTDYQRRLEREIEVVADALCGVPVVTRQDDRPRDLGRELGRLIASDGRSTRWVTLRLHRLLLFRWRLERQESTTQIVDLAFRESGGTGSFSGCRASALPVMRVCRIRQVGDV